MAAISQLEETKNKEKRERYFKNRVWHDLMLCNKSLRTIYGSNNRIMIWILMITTLLAYLELLYNRFF